jgi:hypothetical protein
MSKVFAIVQDMKNARYESHVCTMLIVVTYNMLIDLRNKSFMIQEELAIIKKCMMLCAYCIPFMISSFQQFTLTYVGGCSRIFLDMEVVVCKSIMAPLLSSSTLKFF